MVANEGIEIAVDMQDKVQEQGEEFHRRGIIPAA
jgi:hypothetical protein